MFDWSIDVDCDLDQWVMPDPPDEPLHDEHVLIWLYEAYKGCGLPY